jgi:hypothetical protein
VRGAFNVAAVPAAPHPGAALRPDYIKEEDATNYDAVLQHVVVIIAPLTGWA